MRSSVNARDQTRAIAAIARLFSSGMVRELARKGRSSAFARLIGEANLLHELGAKALVRDAFEAAFSVLRLKANRHEYIYKAALTHKVLLGAHSLQTASMLTEFRAGQSKADLVILNGTATVYEIKSERDSLSRLQKQLQAYRQVFAKAYVIAGDNHIDAVLKAAPCDVGVMLLSNRHQISTVRAADDRPDRTSAGAIFDALRSSEAKKILELRGAKIPNVPNTQMAATLRAMFVQLRPVEAHAGMVQVLKKTRNLSPLASLVDELPLSLAPAALTVPLRLSDRSRLVQTVNTPMADAMNWN